MARAEEQAQQLATADPAQWITGQPEREADLAEEIVRWVYRLAQVGAWDVLDQYNPDSSGWDADVMLAWLRTAAATYATRIEQGTTEEVEAAAAEEDVPVAMAAVAAGLAAAATLHATTAAAEVVSFGGMDAARASGLTRKTWHTSSTNPRTSHAAQNGEAVDLGDVFSNGLRYPGDYAAGDVDETANCNCYLTYS
ncbi:hypothetical protein [Streptomonospora salina]|uniref:hypothetical protein n=1 Tax=Streptomonospora salina TaxID=104205 RepID=UPI0031EF9B25